MSTIQGVIAWVISKLDKGKAQGRFKKILQVWSTPELHEMRSNYLSILLCPQQKIYFKIKAFCESLEQMSVALSWSFKMLETLISGSHKSVYNWCEDDVGIYTSNYKKL